MGNVRMRAEQINYGATNVKVALDDLDPAALIALNNRMNKIDAWKATVKTEEKTGAEVTFTNALALPAVSLSAEIEAAQDLHGYDKPWVGGAGKNKLPMTVSSIKAANTSGTWNGNVYSIANGTIEMLVDSADNVLGFKAKGTFNTTVTFAIMPSANLGITGILNGAPATGSLSTYEIQVALTGETYRDYGSGTSAFNWNEAQKAYIVLRSGYATPTDGIIFRPMFRLSTESDPTFAPYSNICPISGHSSVTITRTDAESQTATVTVQLGQTVYGGSLNLTTGVLTVKWAIVVISNINQWYYSDSYHLFYAELPSAKFTASLYGFPCLCSHYHPTTEAWTSMANNTLSCGSNTRGNGKPCINVKTEDYSDVDTFKAAINGVQLAYQLATPTAIQLTPEQLTMLKGCNRLSSDGGGDITVEAYTGAAWGGDES